MSRETQYCEKHKTYCYSNCGIAYTAFLKNTAVIFGSGKTKFEAIKNAKINYLNKYPEKKSDINNIKFDVIE